MIKKGDLVQFVRDPLSNYHPPLGTIGEALEDEEKGRCLYVQWPKWTTPDDGCWYVTRAYVEPISCVEAASDKDYSHLVQSLDKLF